MDSTKTASLSPMQQGLLFHFLRDGRSGIDVVQLVCELPETIEPAPLRAAWQAAADRHEGLRTAFCRSDAGEPAQCFVPEIAIDWAEEDWSETPPSEREARLSAFLDTDRERGFDLTEPPLWRIRLIRYGPVDHRCIWTLHHFMADGRSCASVLEEVFADHAAAVGGADRSPAVTNRYNADGIVQSNRFLEWLDERDASGDERFWREYLAGLAEPTRMADADRPAGRGRGIREVRLSAAASASVRAAADRFGVSLNTLVQAAWSLVVARHAAARDVVFGVIRAGRSAVLSAEDRSVGVYINTVPMRVQVDRGLDLGDFLAALRERQRSIRPYEHTPLARIQQWSDAGGAALFDSLLIYDHASLGEALRALGGGWSNRRVHHLEQTGYPVTAYGYGEERILLRVAWVREHVADATGERLLRHFTTALNGLADPAARTVGDVPVLDDAETGQLLACGSGPALAVEDTSIPRRFARAVRERGDAVAVEDGSRSLTFRELDGRADELARHLVHAGVQRGDRVGIALNRSVDLPVALMAVLRTGAAYVPLDPAYPPDRLAFMAGDAGLRVLITRRDLAARAPAGTACLFIDALPDGRVHADGDPLPDVCADDVAYVIYTSGSTGRPKGVQVEHRNVCSFFAAMDLRLEPRPDDVWLALTSLSFDISVLELLWTLTRGLRVVIHADAQSADAGRGPGFSLFYFASGGEHDGGDGYRLLLDGARWADTHGFEAVWTPERHFHKFGGLYPNPAVAGAAVAAITERVDVRAGSVVLPLHHPARVAEEWSVVDRLSGGRVGVSFAAGWHPEDFALAPDQYEDRREGVYRAADQVRRLWRGEKLSFPGPKGDVDLGTLPRPVQPELPVWMTTSGTRATFERAGAEGYNVLTHLLGQTLEDLSGNIAAYRQARAEHGHDAAGGRVTLMVHTFVAEDEDEAREAVRAPLIAYLSSAVDLVRNFADAWTAVSRHAAPLTSGRDILSQLSPEDREGLLGFAFERYFETSGLLGSVSKCVAMARSIRACGVDEIACLIDFGVPVERTLRHLELLDRVRRETEQAVASEPTAIGPTIVERGVTHVQCTPSRARLLLADPVTRASLATLRRLLVGGEALAGDLARELVETVGGDVLNMYGPTETTVWSSVHTVQGGEEGTVPIGRPVANTSCRVVGADGGLAPVGVPGELWIGGAAVARGYHGRPELTADRFVDDPCAGGGRMYRTGDLVRWRDDGVLEFLGRNDQQVKVRGHRIELGEVEAALAEHPEVAQAAVRTVADGTAGMRLIGYVVPHDGAAAGLETRVRTDIAGRLPEPMVPARIVVLDRMPVTPNGKLDRRALPESGSEGPAPTEAGSPVTSLEAVIAGIWRDALGVENVGVTDNFFDLGGHSLMTIQVQNRLREHLSRDVPITDIFRFPTVRSLAAHLDGAGGVADGAQTGSKRAELRRQALGRRVRSG